MQHELRGEVFSEAEVKGVSDVGGPNTIVRLIKGTHGDVVRRVEERGYGRVDVGLATGIDHHSDLYYLVRDVRGVGDVAKQNDQVIRLFERSGWGQGASIVRA